MQGVCETCRDGRVRSNGLCPANQRQDDDGTAAGRLRIMVEDRVSPESAWRHSGALESSITSPPVCLHRL
jgi:hypothetical protein